MTISSEGNRIQYNGNGVTVLFAFPYPFFDDTDLVVVSTIVATGTNTNLILNVDYTVTGGSGSSGSITTTVPVASGTRLTIYRDIPYTQDTDYREYEAFSADVVETDYDRAAVRDQQLLDAQGRALSLSVTTPTSVSTMLPDPVADTFFGWNSSADAIENKVAADLALYPVSPYIATLLDDPDAATARTTLGLGELSTKSRNLDIPLNFAKGSDIASAATTNIGAATGNYVNITGTTTITAFDTVQAGTVRTLRFAGVVTVTNNANIINFTGANITTAAGDILEYTSEGGGVWRMTDMARFSGSPLVQASPFTLLTPTTTTSGTTSQYTGLPSNVKRITGVLNAVSLSATSHILVQIGPVGGVETTGYLGAFGYITASPASAQMSTGFGIFSNQATAVHHGQFTITLTDSSTNTWGFSWNGGWTTSSLVTLGGGTKSLAGTLERIRIASLNGTDTFDGGSWNIMYEV